MVYAKRFDGRKFDELRKIEAEVGIIPNADGSARFKIGKTEAIVGVYGPKEMHPKFLQNPRKGTLRCKYDMISFSVNDRARPGPSRRSQELGLVIASALEPVCLLNDFPKLIVDVFIEIPQADAGTRCAAICAASMALADAGIPMKDLVAAVAVGKIGDKICLDINKEEEDYDGPGGATDIPIAYSPVENKLTLLQLDGKIKGEDLTKAVEMGIKGAKKIYEIQKIALKKKYKVDEILGKKI